MGLAGSVCSLPERPYPPRTTSRPASSVIISPSVSMAFGESGGGNVVAYSPSPFRSNGARRLLVALTMRGPGSMISRLRAASHAALRRGCVGG